jgi:hypothetical protein
MKTKFQKIIALAIGILFLPTVVFAANDWGVGLTVDQSGNYGIGMGYGSQGSGAGNVWGGGSYGMMGGGWALANPYGLPQGSILGIASNLLFWLLAIFAIAGVVGFVISGIFYLVAAGDEGTAEKGKNGIKWSIIGIIVGLSGFLIMQAVAALLSGGTSKF